MINPQWLELPLSRINFHGPKDVRAIEVLLYLESYLSYFSTKTNVVCTHEKCLLEALLMSTHNIFLGEIQKYINTFWLEKQKKYLIHYLSRALRQYIKICTFGKLVKNSVWI